MDTDFGQQVLSMTDERIFEEIRKLPQDEMDEVKKATASVVSLSRTWSIVLLDFMFPLILIPIHRNWWAIAGILIVWFLAQAQILRFMRECMRFRRAVALVEIHSRRKKKQESEQEDEAA